MEATEEHIFEQIKDDNNPIKLSLTELFPIKDNKSVDVSKNDKSAFSESYDVSVDIETKVKQLKGKQLRTAEECPVGVESCTSSHEDSLVESDISFDEELDNF